MVGREDSYGLGSNDKINSASTCLLWAPVYTWSAKRLRLLALHPTLTWGNIRDARGCHHPYTYPSDHLIGMQTKEIYSLDTTSTLATSTLTTARLCRQLES